MFPTVVPIRRVNIDPCLSVGEAFQKFLVIVMPVLLMFSALGSRESNVLKPLGQSPAMKSCFTSCLQPHCWETLGEPLFTPWSKPLQGFLSGCVLLICSHLWTAPCFLLRPSVLDVFHSSLRGTLHPALHPVGWLAQTWLSPGSPLMPHWIPRSSWHL